MTTVLKNQEVYHLAEGLKLGNYNVGRSGNILTLPLYMGFLLREDSEKEIIPDIDISGINL